MWPLARQQRKTMVPARDPERGHRARLTGLRSWVRIICTAMACLVGAPVLAETCTRLEHAARSYIMCTARAGDDLRMFLTDDTGDTLGSFARIEQMLAREGRSLGFAMNAGMYHPDRRPVGLYIEAGEQVAPIVTRAGPGNFGMLPNGVFCIRPEGFGIVESRSFALDPAECLHATQSGPMLVIDGTLHPRFLPESESALIRNGVGVSKDGLTAHFVIARTPVNLHDFAVLFRDVLAVPQALYLDGNVSRLHAPGLGLSDWGLPMGPVVGLVIDAAGR